jgi:hypothetical protein
LTCDRRDEARVLFDYLRPEDPVYGELPLSCADRSSACGDGGVDAGCFRAADLVIGFGVDDMRVPDHCARLYRDGRAPLLHLHGGGRERERLFHRARGCRF